jgi:predicted MFS family arabinose efflux permease
MNSGTGGTAWRAWLLVGVSAIALCFGYGGVVNYGFSAFILPLSREHGWERSQIQLAFTIATVGFVLASPVVGALIDRVGSRRLLLPATIAFAVVVCCMRFLGDSLVQLYVMYALLGAVGCGTSFLVYTRLVLSWFEHRKGWALAWLLLGGGMAAVVVVPLVQAVSASFGASMAYTLLGVTNLVVCLPLLALFVRDSPEEARKAPDDRAPWRATSAASAEGLTFAQSLRARSFWILIGIAVCMGASHVTVSSQLVPILSESGLGEAQAARIASLFGIAMIAGRLACGYFIDRVHAPTLATAFLILPAIAFMALSAAPSVGTAVVLAITLGLAFGADADVLPFLCAQYLGKRSFGKNFAVLISTVAVCGGLSSLAAARNYDLVGHYGVMLVAAAGAGFMAVLLLSFLGSYPVHRPHADPSPTS